MIQLQDIVSRPSAAPIAFPLVAQILALDLQENQAIVTEECAERVGIRPRELEIESRLEFSRVVNEVPLARIDEFPGLVR